MSREGCRAEGEIVRARAPLNDKNYLAPIRFARPARVVYPLAQCA